MGARLPEWLRKPQTAFPALHTLKRELRQLRLHTVCESARCPNIHECFQRGTATFLILGDRCTRSCGFCAISKARHGLPLDPEEPRRVAEMAARLDLRHVVITSVTRDDLADGGASQFAATIRAVRGALPTASIEVLTPDFRGRAESVDRVLDAGPDVFGHNLETVATLYPRVRPQADYRRSVELLRYACRARPQMLVKSGFMVGLGEQPEEVRHLLADLREAGVHIVTIGQYLQPTRANLPVAEYVRPEQFDAYREFGLELGFRAVVSAPFVRSSYLAEQALAMAGWPEEVRP